MIDIETNDLERTLIVGVDTGEYDMESSFDEMEELIKTAGAEPVARVTQKRESIDKATCVGKGKLEEIAEICENSEIDLIVFERELSSTHLRNIEKKLPCRVIDRTMLILDIFAGRAFSSEGRLQVELAQLQYILPRLSGLGTSLSRLGGGIGTRGPGETQLETDRRHIRRRIDSLKQQISDVAKQREQRRNRREKDGVTTVAIVGYTNAGKSTLMNLLTDAGVLAENRLFATLDPTSRALILPDGREVLLIDTVGFVRRLPHHLINAFRSTLEEAARADLILNICDISSDDAQEHLAVTRTLLQELGSEDKAVLSVYNKLDLLDVDEVLSIPNSSIKISAKTGEGIDNLLNKIVEAIPNDRRMVNLLIPFTSGALAEQCRVDGVVKSEEFTENGVLMEVVLGLTLLAKTEKFLVD